MDLLLYVYVILVALDELIPESGTDLQCKQKHAVVNHGFCTRGLLGSTNQEHHLYFPLAY